MNALDNSFLDFFVNNFIENCAFSKPRNKLCKNKYFICGKAIKFFHKNVSNLSWKCQQNFLTPKINLQLL